jgi:serine/threonine-protein kinase
MAGQLILGRYRVVRRLARGGMGVVYLARAEGAAGFVKPVVVKRIIPDLTEDEKMAQMFIREARILSNLHHPGIVGVIDFGEEGDAYIMVLEYVHGYHLGRWNRYMRETQGYFPAPLAIQITIEVLGALHYAHTRKRPDGKPLGIVHRDISPSNIFIDLEGHVRLLDFGIARMTGDTSEYKTQEITLKGKLAYLGPELLHGSAPTPQSDIYSTGVVLHELLTGGNEFRGREMSDTVNRVLNNPPSSVEEIRSDVPAGLDEVIRRALAKSHEERYGSAAEFAQALREVRDVSEDQATVQLAEQVRHDFLGDMPGRLGLESLDSIDEAWRNPPQELLSEPDTEPIPVDYEEPESEQRDSDHPTEVSSRAANGARATSPGPATAQAPAAGSPAPPAEKQTSPWAWVTAGIAILGVIAASAVGVAVYVRSASDDPAKVVVVDGQANSDEGSSTDSTDAPPGGADASPGGDAAGAVGTPPESGDDADDRGKRTATTTGRQDSDAHPGRRQDRHNGQRRPQHQPRKGASTGAQGLSRAFAEQQAKVESCFRNHTPDLSGSPRVSIRFHINSAGKVQSATVLPDAVASTSLGQCLVKVARATRFPRQPRAQKFRIPITTRAQ